MQACAYQLQLRQLAIRGLKGVSNNLLHRHSAALFHSDSKLRLAQRGATTLQGFLIRIHLPVSMNQSTRKHFSPPSSSVPHARFPLRILPLKG